MIFKLTEEGKKGGERERERGKKRQDETLHSGENI